MPYLLTAEDDDKLDLKIELSLLFLTDCISVFRSFIFGSLFLSSLYSLYSFSVIYTAVHPTVDSVISNYSCSRKRP